MLREHSPPPLPHTVSPSLLLFCLLNDRTLELDGVILCHLLVQQMNRASESPKEVLMTTQFGYARQADICLV